MRLRTRLAAPALVLLAASAAAANAAEPPVTRTLSVDVPVDSTGLNAAGVNAVWALHGLGLLHLTEDIDELASSNKSVMLEGYEKSIPPEGLADLLAFLAQKSIQ